MHISQPILISGPTAHPNCSAAAEKERLKPRRMSTWNTLADAPLFLNHNASLGVCVCTYIGVCVYGFLHLLCFCDCGHNQIRQMFLSVWLRVLMCILTSFPVCFRCVCAWAYPCACMHACPCAQLSVSSYKSISLVVCPCVCVSLLGGLSACTYVRSWLWVCAPCWVSVLLCGPLVCSPPPHNLGNRFLIFLRCGE